MNTFIHYKNVSWPWLSPLQGWGSLTMSLTCKFVCMYIYIYIHTYIYIYITYSIHNIKCRKVH